MIRLKMTSRLTFAGTRGSSDSWKEAWSVQVLRSNLCVPEVVQIARGLTVTSKSWGYHSLIYWTCPRTHQVASTNGNGISERHGGVRALPVIRDCMGIG